MTADAVGGVWTYAMSLSEELSRGGVDVTLAVMGPAPAPAQIEEAQSIPRLTLERGDFRLEWMEAPWNDVARAGEWLLALAAERGFDLAHLNGFVHAALPWREPVLVAAHSCVCSWWRAVHGVEAPPEWDSYRRRVTQGLAAADHVVAPTQAFLDEMRRRYQPTAPASVIPNARPIEPFVGDSAGPRDELILTSGRLWDEAKNMRILDVAVRGLPWRAYAAGPAISPDGARFAAIGLELVGCLPQRELASWLKRAAIYIHPARYEPFGYGVLEAALSGCALVIADLPTLRETWGDAALYADPNDAAALRVQLERLIAAPSLRREFGRAAMERAGALQPADMGRRYVELYTALIERGRTRERAVA
jgi:glycosyltransferase involved in cell wall biosynthesis